MYLHLKYLTIVETLKTLSMDEIEKISKISSEKSKKASNWFFYQVNEMTQIPTYGRDWTILLPKSDDEFIYIHWTQYCEKFNNNDGKQNKAYIFMKFNTRDVQIVCKVYQICDICVSANKILYSCDRCEFVQNIPIVFATVKDSHIKHTYNPNITLTVPLEEWSMKVLNLYKPLFLNYENIYNGYLHF
jgi:hypothetical protein